MLSFKNIIKKYKHVLMEYLITNLSLESGFRMKYAPHYSFFRNKMVNSTTAWACMKS